MPLPRITRFVSLAMLVVGVALAVTYREHFDAAGLTRWIQAAGFWAPLAFVATYAITAVLFLPGSVMTLTGGALFGPLWGTLYSLTGATLGATLAFLIARHLGADWVAAKVSGQLKRLIQGVEAEGWRFVAFLRLVPLFPFNLINYALGVTGIRLSHYVVATYLCMLPGALAYSYLGDAGREAVSGGENLLQKGLLALALLATVAFLPRLIGRLRQRPMLAVAELKRRLDSGDDLLVLDVRLAKDYTGEQGHIANARNIPVEDLGARLGELEDYLERPIAIVCRTDRRSAQAAKLLARSGFADVHVVRGGMTAWHEAGWPVAMNAERAHKVPMS